MFPRTIPWVLSAGLLGALPALSLTPSLTVHAQGVRPGTLAVENIRVGMKGYGLTVFRGTEPEKFDVEVIGVLHQFRPDQDLVLIKTPHERLNIAHTVAGMSGSPIFLDGKMIGAYAYGWQFGSEPIAGVTPIKNMLQDLARPIPAELLRPMPALPWRQGNTGKRSRFASLDGNGYVGSMNDYDLREHAQQLGTRTASWRTVPSGTSLAATSTPVSLGGLSDRAARSLGELLTPLGFESLQGGGAGAKTVDPQAPTRFTDGGAIGVQLIRGDISAMGLGTVTRVEGDRLVAFGHPMMQGGVSAFPTAIARVHWILASQQRSFKIGEAARPLGTLVNDLQASIVVDQNVTAPTFPLTVTVEGVAGAPKKAWSMELTHDKFLSPSFVGTAIGNAVESTLSERRDTTWEARSKITVKGYGTLEVHDFGVAAGGTPNAEDFTRSHVTRAVGQILNNPWEYAQIERVDTRMKVTFGRDLYTLRGASALDSVVDAGRSVRIQLRLRSFNGPDELKVIEVPMPAALAGREVDIELVPGWAEQPDLSTPDSFADLLANIPRTTFAPDMILATYRLPELGVAYRGQIASRLPPGALDTLRPQFDSTAPEAILTTKRIVFPVGHFLEGRDRVKVKVREALRLPDGRRLALASRFMLFQSTSPRHRKLRACAWVFPSILTTLLALTPSAGAVGTRSFDLTTQEAFSGGDLHGVAVDSRGYVHAGWNLDNLPLAETTSVWSSIAAADGSVLLGTGNTGKVLRVAAGRVTTYAETKQLAVTSLVQGPGGTVFAATLPEGKIFRIEAAGRLTEMPRIVDADNIWALAFDGKKNVLYAATGPNGKLFALPAGGAAQLLFDSDEANLTSLAVGEDGAVYAGSSGKALIFKITGPGRASILYDCPGDEVKALVWGRGGNLFAIANEFADGGPVAEPGRRSPNAPFNAAAPIANTKPNKPGKGTLYRIEANGRAERLLHNAETHYVSLALDEQGKPYVGTGTEGRVYTVDENHTSTLVADTDERQIGAMVLTGGTKFLAATDPAVFHEIRGTGGNDAAWTSKVLDAGLRANFGRLFWRADGTIEFTTRTGNSATPDATWSDWSRPIAAPSATASPPGRYVQIRARFARGPNATLREVRLPFVTDNLRAVVTSIEAQNKGAPASPASITTSKDKDFLPSSGAEMPAHTSVIKLSWRTDNPDNDQLRYRVQFRLDGQSIFRDLTRPDDVQTKNEMDWDTASLPEGTYRVQVEASDETANPPDRVTRHRLESGTVLVDNTPPVFRALAVQNRRLRADVVDGLGPIARIDFALDGRQEWRPLLPKDGIFDGPTEQVDVDLTSALSPGPHLIAVRVYDQAGNFVVRDVEMK